MSKALRGLLVGVASAALSLLLAALVLLAAAVQQAPAVVAQQEPDAGDVARALALVRDNDPRHAVPGVMRTLRLSERDLGLLLNHVGYRGLDASSHVVLDRGQATVRSSVHLPASALTLFGVFGRWLNVELRLHQTDGLPALGALRLGGLPVPAWLGERAALHLAERAGGLAALELAADVVQRVRIEPQQLSVSYTWRDDSTERMFSSLLPADEQARLRVYNDALVHLALQQPGWTVSIAPLLGPIFQLAQQRSAAGADAAAENRAALLVLMLFANGLNVDALLPAARGWPQPRAVQVTLAGRHDFSRHLMVSAALAVEGTGPLSKAIGIYKEVADARSGRGFSFNDMAVNRVGTRLGQMAGSQPQRLQQALARGVEEADLMPAWADLPEFMTEADFQRRFGGVGAPAYLAMMEEIERRVDALALLR